MIELFVLIPIALLGLWLLVRGLRGRRVGDHPHCRRCGFDLFRSTAARCPECGAEISSPASTVVGARERRAKALAAGAALMLFSAGLLGVAGADRAGRIDVLNYEPVWLVLRQTAEHAAEARDAASNELLARLSRGALSGTQVDDVVERFLAYQNDPARPWSSRWGDFIELAYAKQQLTGAQLSRYAIQTIDPELSARSVVRRGDPLPVRIGYDRSHLRPGGLLDFELPVKSWRFKDGSMISDEPGRFSNTLGRHDADAMDFAISVEEVPVNLAEGPQQVTATFHARVWLATDPTRTAIAEADITRAAAWTLTSPDQQSVKLVVTPGLRGEMTKSVMLWESGRRDGSASVVVAGPPVAVCARILARDSDGRIRHLEGPVLVPAGQSARWGISPRKPAFNDGSATDVIVRPDPAAAAATVDVREIWGEDIVFPKVEMDRRK
jgi:hypothetical protein